MTYIEKLSLLCSLFTLYQLNNLKKTVKNRSIQLEKVATHKVLSARERAILVINKKSDYDKIKKATDYVAYKLTTLLFICVKIKNTMINYVKNISR